MRCIETLLGARTPQVDLINDSGTGDERFSAVKLYLAEEELVLSEFLPVLENLGLKVFAEDPVAVTLPEVGQVRIHTFFVQDTAGARLDVARAAPLLKPALLMLHAGRIENDPLNALILQAGLEWRQVDLLRTYVNHGVQIGTAPSRGTLMRALLNAPQAARILCEYFEAKFDPLRAGAAARPLDADAAGNRAAVHGQSRRGAERRRGSHPARPVQYRCRHRAYHVLQDPRPSRACRSRPSR